ncbi:uncharacterized protein LOC144334790 [Macaca mulatta]
MGKPSAGSELSISPEPFWNLPKLAVYYDEAALSHSRNRVSDLLQDTGLAGKGERLNSASKSCTRLCRRPGPAPAGPAPPHCACAVGRRRQAPGRRGRRSSAGAVRVRPGCWGAGGVRGEGAGAGRRRLARAGAGGSANERRRNPWACGLQPRRPAGEARAGRAWVVRGCGPPAGQGCGGLPGGAGERGPRGARRSIVQRAAPAQRPLPAGPRRGPGRGGPGPPGGRALLCSPAPTPQSPHLRRPPPTWPPPSRPQFPGRRRPLSARFVWSRAGRPAGRGRRRCAVGRGEGALRQNAGGEGERCIIPGRRRGRGGGRGGTPARRVGSPRGRGPALGPPLPGPGDGRGPCKLRAPRMRGFPRRRNAHRPVLAPAQPLS